MKKVTLAVVERARAGERQVVVNSSTLPLTGV